MGRVRRFELKPSPFRSWHLRIEIFSSHWDSHRAPLWGPTEPHKAQVTVVQPLTEPLAQAAHETTVAALSRSGTIQIHKQIIGGKYRLETMMHSKWGGEQEIWKNDSSKMVIPYRKCQLIEALSWLVLLPI